MKLNYNVDNIPAIKKGRKGHVTPLLCSFIESGKDKAKVLWSGEYKSARAAANILKIAAKRKNLPIVVIQRKEEIYLLREDQNV